MTPKLTTDQRQAIEERGGKPVYLVDGDTNATYVLMRADQYEKVKSVFEQSGDIDPRDAYPLVDAVMRDDDQNDPTLDHYQQYTAKKP